MWRASQRWDRLNAPACQTTGRLRLTPQGIYGVSGFCCAPGAGTAKSVSLGPILCLKTADPLEITVYRDYNGFQGARCRRNPEIVLIKRGALLLGFPFD